MKLTLTDKDGLSTTFNDAELNSMQGKDIFELVCENFAPCEVCSQPTLAESGICKGCALKS